MWTLMVNHANFADLVITPSVHFQKKLKHYGVKKQIQVLPNGVSDELFIPDLKPRVFSAEKPLKIIWHSRVSKEKRIMPFLEALTKVQGAYQLDVYGDGNDFKKAKKYTRSHHLKVNFHGPTPFTKIYPEIIKSHLDVLNSYNFDTFGMTLVEAESAGTPALFVDPDLKEIIPASGAVFVKSLETSNIPPSSSEVTRAIDDLILHPDKITQMSTTMLSHRDSVRISNIITTLENYIHQLL